MAGRRSGAYNPARRPSHDPPCFRPAHRARRPSLTLQAGSAPVRAKRGMVITQSDIASDIGFQVIRDGGNAVDAAVATAFALAVTHPTAGNIGGGGFLVYPPGSGRGDDVRFSRERRRRDPIPRCGWWTASTTRSCITTAIAPSACPARSRDCISRGRRSAASRGRTSSTPAVKLARDGFEMSDGARAIARADARQLQEVPGVAGAVLQERHAVSSRRDLQAARPRAHARAHCGPGPGRLLRGRDRRADRERDEGQRRPHHARGPQELPGEAARADQRHLSRLRDHRHGAAELRRHRRADDAEHPRRLRPQGQRLRLGAEHSPASPNRCGARLPIARSTSAIPTSSRRCRSIGCSRRTTPRSCARRSTRSQASKSSPTTFTWTHRVGGDHALLDRRCAAQRRRR